MCFNQFIFIDIIVNRVGFNFVFQCLLLVYKATVVFTFGCGVGYLKFSVEEFLASASLQYWCVYESRLLCVQTECISYPWSLWPCCGCSDHMCLVATGLDAQAVGQCVGEAPHVEGRGDPTLGLTSLPPQSLSQ